MSFTEPLQFARKLHCSLLARSGIDGVDGSCLHAAILLKAMIDLYSGHPCAQIRGGDGKNDGAYTDAEGREHGHYWVEAATDAGERFVLDVTADQFGGPELVQWTVDRAARQYRPGNQDLVELHVQHIVDARDIDEIRAAVEHHDSQRQATAEA